MNLISGTHHSCERREYAFMVLREYTLISRQLALVKSDTLIYNIMAKMAMKDKKTENSRETTAAALRRLWSYGSHLI